MLLEQFLIPAVTFIDREVEEDVEQQGEAAEPVQFSDRHLPGDDDLEDVEIKDSDQDQIDVEQGFMNDRPVCCRNADLLIRFGDIGEKQGRIEKSHDQDGDDAVDLPDFIKMKDQEMEGRQTDADAGHDDTGKDLNDEGGLDQVREEFTVLPFCVQDIEDQRNGSDTKTGQGGIDIDIAIMFQKQIGNQRC